MTDEVASEDGSVPESTRLPTSVSFQWLRDSIQCTTFLPMEKYLLPDYTMAGDKNTVTIFDESSGLSLLQDSRRRTSPSGRVKHYEEQLLKGSSFVIDYDYSFEERSLLKTVIA